MSKPKAPCILYMGSFPPRECGIATFTKRLTDAIDKEFYPEVKSKVLAINSNGTSIYNYQRKVVLQINETEIEDYLNRAHEINRNPEIKLVNIQHEYGLFGGEQGEFLIPFLELLAKPVVITMHTILPHPDEKMRKVGRVISEKSAGVIVMTHAAKDILVEVYGVKKNLIHVIPHGVFHVPFPSKSRAKKKIGLDPARLVVSTFGMISRDKGIEYAIEALPEVVREHPNVLYLIIGATHPQVLRREGERYRNRLKRLIEKHSLQEHVKFYNKYLAEHEVTDFLKATDIYIYPMLSKDQASSGSLSDAMSCACPAIATDSLYAKSVLNRERGILVRFRSSEDIKKALLELITDKQRRKEMSKNTYFYTRHMTWQNVALSYFQTFNHFAKIKPRNQEKWPAIKFDYVKNLTDQFGMIQFATHTKPDIHSGYCLDDNARALIAAAEWYGRKKIKSTLDLAYLYLKFVKFTQKSNGHFRNFVSYQKTFNDKTHSDDSYGRAVWALGFVLSREYLPEDMRKMAAAMLKKALPWIGELESLRAFAFTIIGLGYLAGHDDATAQFKVGADPKQLIKKLSDSLVRRFEAQARSNENKDWSWFEDCLTYSNYKLTEALYLAHEATGNPRYLEVAESALGFLNSVSFEHLDYFMPIGQDGWYFRNGKRAYFDQQPEDAASAVEALVTAYLTTKKKEYKDKALLTFQWFLGKNHLNQMVYDEATGGCYDGLGRYSLNFNQGAESSISYLLARLAVEKIADK